MFKSGEGKKTLAECHKFYPINGYLIEYTSTNKDDYNLAKNSTPAFVLIKQLLLYSHGNKMITGFYTI